MKETLSALKYMGDSQVETTLLRSCLALPKLSYILRTCPPDYISHATRQFDSTMRESLETIVTSPLTDWSRQKASNRGGLNLRSAVSHAPAAFISSAASSKTLMERILNHPINIDAYLENAVSALSSSTSHPEWLNLDDIDIPLRQRHLSCAIDEAIYQNLLDTSPTTRARASANSSALSTSPWRLVEQRTIRGTWPSHAGQGIQQLPEILARYPSPQCPPPLPGMSHHR